MPIADPDIGAAGDHRLLGLAGALSAHRLDRDAVPGVDAGALAQLDRRRIPVAALPRRRSSAHPPPLPPSRRRRSPPSSNTPPAIDRRLMAISRCSIYCGVMFAALMISPHFHALGADLRGELLRAVADEPRAGLAEALLHRGSCAAPPRSPGAAARRSPPACRPAPRRRTRTTPRSSATPASAAVGTSGSSAMRCFAATASGRSLPALICAMHGRRIVDHAVDLAGDQVGAPPAPRRDTARG